MAEQVAAGFFTRAIFAAFDEEASTRTRLFVVSIWFQGCLMVDPPDVGIAFQVLGQKVRGCLVAAQQPRAAILTDVYSLAMNDPIRPLWGRALRAFLDEYCLQVVAGQHLAARYNHAPVFSTSNTPSMVGTFKRLLAEQGQLAGFQPNVAESRDEALSILWNLRMQAFSRSSPGSPPSIPSSE
ncbi:MAG TPA: hypothetical protein VKQ30_11910 [Ktedonobacterales bacterium]|nr:hypothetical protein [Ktedonobacterales bacterium]